MGHSTLPFRHPRMNRNCLGESAPRSAILQSMKSPTITKWLTHSMRCSECSTVGACGSPLRVPMTTRAFPRRLMAVLSVLIAGVLLTFSLRACRRSGAEEYRTFASPDGRFEIVVFRIPSRIAMPGQSLDSPGYFQLRDARTGRVLQERSVEMVQFVERIEWSPTNVDVRLLANWSLPQ